MSTTLSEETFDRQNELITLARQGEITPEQAEAEAAAKGWEPFAYEPDLPHFDPMTQSRWPIIMAIAWIASRDVELVRRNNPAFRCESRHWIFQEWNQPVADGTAFQRRAGWFLEYWREATTVRLSLEEKFLRVRNELPSTWQMPVLEAEAALWRALVDGELIAEALDCNGKPTDVPQREWCYLKLFEDGKRDVLRYDALDRKDPFTDVKLKREDILRLWPKLRTNATSAFHLGMIEPLTSAGPDGLVPLSAVVLWIMTSGGTQPGKLNDHPAWTQATDKLMAVIHTGKVKVVGLCASEPLAQEIPGHALALVKVLSPDDTLDRVAVAASAYIACTPYIDKEEWNAEYNDQLFIRGQGSPRWTHLQLRKSDVLEKWPRPDAKARPQQDCTEWLREEMERSPSRKTKPKGDFREEAKRKFAGLADRQFVRAWGDAVTLSGATAWSKAGRSRKIESPHRVKS